MRLWCTLLKAMQNNKNWLLTAYHKQYCAMRAHADWQNQILGGCQKVGKKSSWRWSTATLNSAAISGERVGKLNSEKLVSIAFTHEQTQKGEQGLWPCSSSWSCWCWPEGVFERSWCSILWWVQGIALETNTNRLNMMVTNFTAARITIIELCKKKIKK